MVTISINAELIVPISSNKLSLATTKRQVTTWIFCGKLYAWLLTTPLWYYG